MEYRTRHIVDVPCALALGADHAAELDRSRTPDPELSDAAFGFWAGFARFIRVMPLAFCPV